MIILTTFQLRFLRRIHQYARLIET